MQIDTDEENSEALSGEELLTQTQKMVFDSDDNMEILTPSALNALLMKKDTINKESKEVIKTNKETKPNNNINDINGKRQDTINKESKEVIQINKETKPNNDINGKDLKVMDLKDRYSKFYPPEMLKGIVRYTKK